MSATGKLTFLHIQEKISFLNKISVLWFETGFPIQICEKRNVVIAVKLWNFCYTDNKWNIVDGLRLQGTTLLRTRCVKWVGKHLHYFGSLLNLLPWFHRHWRLRNDASADLRTTSVARVAMHSPAKHPLHTYYVISRLNCNTFNNEIRLITLFFFNFRA